jgi:hypothetical protein
VDKMRDRNTFQRHLNLMRYRRLLKIETDEIRRDYLRHSIDEKQRKQADAGDPTLAAALADLAR